MKKNERMTGFPSPAEDYKKSKLSIDDRVIQHPDATFFVRMEGEAMIGAGINEGDILVVDRSIYPPKHGDVIVAVVDKEYIARRYVLDDNAIWLRSANVHFPSLKINKDMNMTMWGVVIVVLHYP